MRTKHTFFKALRILLTLLLSVLLEHASAENKCATEAVCIETEVQGQTTVVFGVNKNAEPVSIQLDLTLNNLTSSAGSRVITTLPKDSRTEITRLGPRGAGARGFRYKYRWGQGVQTSLRGPREFEPYELPFQSGLAFRVRDVGPQATDKTAVAWEMPEGTEVLAARAGRVIATRSRAEQGTPVSAREANYGSFVTIQHEDGSVGTYRFFRENGILVHEGQRVELSSRLGYSGYSGFDRIPTLLFEVSYPLLGKDQSFARLEFRTKQGERTMLRPGQAYQAP